MNCFYNNQEKRLRFVWRFLIFIFVVALAANFADFVTDRFSKPYKSTVLNASALLVFLPALFFSAKFLEKREFKEYRAKISIKEFLYGIILGFLLISVITLVQYLSNWLTVKDFRISPSGINFHTIILFQVARYLFGSILEELFSRGYLFVNIAEAFTSAKIQKTKGVAISLVITSLLFGLLHLFNSNASEIAAINLCLFGFLFGLLSLLKDNLSIVIGLHAAWNIAQNNVFGFNNSGKEPVASIINFQNSGPDIWTGGNFGPEGGLICSIVLAITIFCLLFQARKKSLFSNFKTTYIN